MLEEEGGEDSPSLEESHVKYGGVRVHELQQEGLQDETLLKVGFRFGNLWKRRGRSTKSLLADNLQTPGLA